MKLKTTIALINVGILVFAAVLTLSLSERSILHNGRRAIESVRRETLGLVKDQLADMVSIAYSMIEGNYKETGNKAFLKEKYGSKLKNFADSAMLIMAEEMQKTEVHEAPGAKAKVLPLTAIKRLPSRKNIILWIVNGDGKAEVISRGENSPAEIIKSFPDEPAGFIYNMDSGKLPKIIYFARFLPLQITVAVGMSGESIMEDAITESKEDMRLFVYDGGLGYVFINNMQCRSVVHPFRPEIENRDYSNVTDSRGKKYVSEMVRICREKGEGFLEYYWAKPENGKASPADAPKISFVKLFKPWNWIIGSGAYIDNINDAVAAKQKDMEAQVNDLKIRVWVYTLIITLVMIIFSLIFAGTITRPIVRLIETMRNLDPGDLSSSSISLHGFSEVRALGDIYNRMLDTIRRKILDIREATATSEKLESELKVAQGIQMSIIPKLVPEIMKRKELDIFAKLKTSRKMGGDFYDFFMMDENRLCLAVGNVSGNGVAASLFMAISKTLLRAKAHPEMSAGEIVTTINQLLCGDGANDISMTFLLAILDLRTGSLNYCNANYNPAYLIRERKDFEKIQIVHGAALGISAADDYQDDTVNLSPDDMIVLFSAGVTETVGAKMKEFKDERFRDILKRGCRKNAESCVELILNELEAFAQGADQPDDITVLVMRFNGGASK